MKSIKADVDKVVEHLTLKLGATWAQASVVRGQRSSKLINPPCAPKPWASRDRKVAANAGRDFDSWIRGHLDSKVTWM